MLQNCISPAVFTTITAWPLGAWGGVLCARFRRAGPPGVIEKPPVREPGQAGPWQSGTDPIAADTQATVPDRAPGGAGAGLVAADHPRCADSLSSYKGYCPGLG